MTTSLRLRVRESPLLVSILGDSLIREVTPGALQAAGLPEVAAQLRELPTLTPAMITTPGALSDVESASRRAHTAVLGLHRRTVELLGSDRCRMTDAALLSYTGATQWTDPQRAWQWIHGPQFTSPAASWAYATWIRSIGVLHLWGSDEKAATIGAMLNTTVDELTGRAFLECDDAYLLTPDDPGPQ